MTANQIALRRATEEERSNKAQEHLKAFENATKYTQAQAAQTQAYSAFQNAMTNLDEYLLKKEESTSKKAANWGSAVSGILGAIAKGVAAAFA